MSEALFPVISELSFGWSTGDIATAVKLIYDLIQALDSYDGAAGDYREATFAAACYPSYAKEIEEQVAQIREPVESFLKAVAKFRLSLGQKTSPAYHRNVFKKLHGIFWYPRKGA
ncbi:hypothetical protein BDZ45DRAFT_742474 [Acephala macrosclerotiorum]|nr:hypothetical protein BDZ45DRAFT_742474 [Acephala macrosclerotiorum]